MALSWGVESYLVERVKHTDQLMVQADDVLLGENLAALGDKVVVISGSPPGKAGTTNDMRVHIVGEGHNPQKPDPEELDH